MNVMWTLLYVLCLAVCRAAAGGGDNNGYEVVFAVNAGGNAYEDSNGVKFDRDPLMDRIGIASDYGKNLLTIGRVENVDDEKLYQTERYHTSTFGYDMPIRGDGDYLLVLMFCEVYFKAPNMKVFDVVLNQEHTVVAGLDIYDQVGHGNAHNEYIRFTVSRGRLHHRFEESEIRGGRVRVEFIKGFRDNPKVNAIALYKGNIDRVPQLAPLKDKDAAAATDDQSTPVPPIVRKVPDEVSRQNRQAFAEQQRNVEAFAEEYVPEHKPSAPDSNSRKTSGPKQEDPYALDDSSVMLPVFIAIGAFIPLLFCLCKL